MNNPLHKYEAENETIKLRNIIAQQEHELCLLKNIIDKLPDSIYWKNREGVYLGRNHSSTESMCKFGFPWKWSEILGKTDYDLFDRHMADKFRKNDLYVMETGCEVTQEEVAHLPSGEKHIQLSTKRPLQNAEGDIVGVIGNTIDITYLKKKEEELQIAKEKAEQANRVKMNFIKNMEHDIRTPFTGVWSLSNHLWESETDPIKKGLLGSIVQAAKELLDFCNAILDFSKNEAAPLPLSHKKFDISALLKKVIAVETPAAKSKKLTLFLDYASNLPKMVIGDESRLYRVLLNLLSNAVKFTDAGQVSLLVQLTEKNANAIFLKFRVIDTGIGISKEHQEIIYEAFSRLTPANTNKYKGLGLGLKIVKQLLHEMNGSITLISTLGAGSTFTFTLLFELY